MALALQFCFITTVLGILISLPVSGGQLVSGRKADIRQGLLDFSRVVDGIAKFPTDEKMIENLNKVSGFFGVAGGILSFILTFIPEEESAELKFMKENFAEVNMKLDRITNELDNVKDMITMESQRAAYIDAASKILSGYNHLQPYFEALAAVNCSSSNECLRKRLTISDYYLKHFNVKAELYQILTATSDSTSVFGDPLLQLIQTTYKCNVPKVYTFANGVIKLAFKAQQIILTYEKLAATTTGVASSLMQWSKLVYNVRKKADEIRIDCFNNINKYIREDVENTIYQTNMKSNRDSADEMKKALDEKYPWVFWTIISYSAYGGSAHMGRSAFLNMPGSREARKRVLRVVPQDKGTYSNQRQELSNAIRHIAGNTKFSENGAYNADTIYQKYENELRKTLIWNKLSAFLVLVTFEDPQIAIDAKHQLYFYYEIVKAYYDTTEILSEFSGATTYTTFNNFRIFATFKSTEQIAGTTCPDCHFGGSCIRKPYSSTSYCSCQPFYDGSFCKQYNKISLSVSTNGMLTVTARIPKLTDIYYGLVDTQNSMDKSVTALQLSLQNKFDNLNEKLLSEFDRANLISQYSESISSLLYFIKRFQTLNSTSATYTAESTALARSVLHPRGVEKWVFELNNLITGNNNIFLKHKPLLVSLMEENRQIACSVKYKEVIDNSWRQIMILQHQLFMLWAEAMSILNMSSDQILEKYNKTVSYQEAFMNKSTCDLSIPHSINLQCSGGYYAYPGFQLINKCEDGHYLVGDSLVTCNNVSSRCLTCNCNTEGSSSTECDQTGQCNCINNYYGKTCHDRNCILSEWGTFGSCSSKTFCKGTQIRTRTITTQKGDGEHCIGDTKTVDVKDCYGVRSFFPIDCRSHRTRSEIPNRKRTFNAAKSGRFFPYFG